MVTNNTNNNQMLTKVLDMLLRYHRHLGLTHEQYILLHSCIQYDDMAVIEDITGFSEKKIIKMLEELMEKDLIVYHAQKGIEIEQLYERLLAAEKSTLSFRELLIREYQKDRKHIGYVELVPMKEGIAVRLQDGKMLPLEKVRELTEELNLYVQSAMKEELQQSNRRLFTDQRRKGIHKTGRIKKVNKSIK